MTDERAAAAKGSPLEVFWAFLGLGQPNYYYLGYSFLVSVVVMWAGLIVFRSCEREFADVI